jgi:pantoate--beta-alanine ligase
MRAWSRENRAAGQTVALVPTMGYLHEGHLSLVRAAAEHADVVVVSVYVNESQFAEGEDLDIYPRDMEGDLQKLNGLVDVVFCPAALYPHGLAAHQSYVQVCVYYTQCGCFLPPRAKRAQWLLPKARPMWWVGLY